MNLTNSRLKPVKELEIPDTEIILRILEGEKHLFEVIMRRYNPKLFHIGRSIIKNDDEVEDVLQETYMKAYENLNTFANRSAFSTWLIKILINTALARRAQIKRLEYEDSKIDGSGKSFIYSKIEKPDMKTPEKNTINNELRNYLETAVDNLPQIYRSVFMMREIENMSVYETSECLQISESNVKVRLNRAKEMLRESLSDVYNEVEIFQFLGVRCDRLVERVMNKLNIFSS